MKISIREVYEQRNKFQVEIEYITTSPEVTLDMSDAGRHRYRVSIRFNEKFISTTLTSPSSNPIDCTGMMVVLSDFYVPGNGATSEMSKLEREFSDEYGDDFWDECHYGGWLENKIHRFPVKSILQCVKIEYSNSREGYIVLWTDVTGRAKGIFKEVYESAWDAYQAVVGEVSKK